MKLKNYEEKELYSGTVLRFEAGTPFNETVDFMLMDYPEGESGFAIYCVSGY